MRIVAYILVALTGFAYPVKGQDNQDNIYRSDTLLIQSKILNSKRLLFVYLPKSYDKDTTKSYSVYYTSDAPLQSNLYADLLRLHGLTNSVPECIVVGLSGDNREYNLSPDKGAASYLRYIASEVIPYIKHKYRTNPFKVLAGHSLGGDFVIFSMITQPSLFNAYIAGSPGPVDPILQKLNDPMLHINSEDFRFFYSSVGSDDFTDTTVFRLLETRLKEKAGNHFECHFTINKGENHISNIVINDQNAIEMLYRNWQFRLPDQLNIPVSEALKAHYTQLEHTFGYKPDIGEWEVFYPLMDQLARRGDFTNAIDLLHYCIELYPDSDQAYAFLAKAYFDTGQKELGIKYLNKALMLNPDNPFAVRMKKLLENKK